MGHAWVTEDESLHDLNIVDWGFKSQLNQQWEYALCWYLTLKFDLSPYMTEILLTGALSLNSISSGNMHLADTSPESLHDWNIVDWGFKSQYAPCWYFTLKFDCTQQAHNLQTTLYQRRWRRIDVVSTSFLFGTNDSAS